MITQANRISLWGSRAFAVGFVALLAACAAPNETLKQAQEAYEKARQDPEITIKAPVELHEAGESLKRAEQAGNKKETAHHARIAKRRIEIARTEAQRKTAEAESERLLEERGRVMLQARTREVKQLTEELAELKAKQTARGFVMTLGDVLFAYNRANLKPGARQSLYRLVSILNAHPEQNIVIEGHTDSKGSESYNLDLSERRAQAVQHFLIVNGINPERITARGFGEAYPVASNSTEAGRQQNRRVEIIFPPRSAEPAAVSE